MDASGSAHPSDQTLRAYGAGKLYGSLAESVQSHLSGCGECLHRVAEISPGTLLGRDRDADSPAPVGLSMIEGSLGSIKQPSANSIPQGLTDHPDYEILGELGSGGMGVVYLAWNKLMGRKEVLKVVSRDLMHRRGVLDRFLREIRNAAQLHHSNIVTAYSAIRAGDSIAFAMEYVEGHDLAELVKRNGRLSVAHACNFIYQAALGLQHAYERGMVHRDIKPSNLILTRHGKKPVVKVLDFGLAKATREGAIDRSLTHEGQMLGTPDYIAPEQSLDAHKADIRADIYSLGCTLYYLLSGAPPFTGSSLYEVLQAHHSMEATPLNVLRSDVPTDLAVIIAKMMAKDPAWRYQTPIEVAKALKPFYLGIEDGSGGSTSDRSQTSQARPSQRSRQNSSKSLTDDERALIADRKPVNKTYRSRPAVSDEEAPEALEDASGYKPEVFGRPIPRLHTTRKGPQVRPILVGVICLGVLGAGYLLMTWDRSSEEAKPPKEQIQLAEVTSATKTEQHRPTVTNIRPAEEARSGAVPEIANVTEINTKHPDKQTVRLRISVSKEGECRVELGRSISDEPERTGGMVPITTVYANSFVGENHIASDEKGSSRFQPIVPQFAKASSMLLCPRAFRLPSVLTLDITELKDGSVGVQYITPTVNIVVYVESEDGLREQAKIIAVASSNDNSGQVPRYGDAKKRVKVEKPVNLSQSDELSFKLPLSEQQLGELFTIDTVLRARPGQTDPKPAVAIRNARLQGSRDRTLGMELGVNQGKVVVEQVESNSLAAKAGINVGDQVVALDGEMLSSPRDSGGLTLAFSLGIKPKVALTILRRGMKRTITINFE